MKYCIEILFGIFCMAFALVMLCAIAFLPLEGTAAMVALVLAAVSVIVGLLVAIDGFIFGIKKS